MIHTVKGFGIVNKSEIDVFLGLSCFFHDAVDVGNLISGSSAFSKCSQWPWKRQTLQSPRVKDTHQRPRATWRGGVSSQQATWFSAAAAAAKSLQSQLTLCDPIDGSPPGSPIPGILQARTLEWVAISFPNGWKWKVKVKSLSRVRLLGTPWTASHQAPLFTGFSRQEYWSGVPLPSLTLFSTYT